MRYTGQAPAPTEESNADRTDNKWGAGKPYTLTYPMTQPTIQGADTAWFGPLQPLKPMVGDPESAGVAGRRFDYPTGYNLQQRPRGYEPVSFGDLRALSQNCDIMRLVIETRKDQLSGMDFQVRVKAEPGEDVRRVKASADQKKRIAQITEFMQSPDQELDFDQWTRAFFEDHFVIDAPVIYKRRTKGGQLYGLELIDGATISPLLDATGRRPLPPDAAYQQILKGVPAVDYSADDMYYCARNVRTHKVYGYSPVEQILITANIAIRRAIFQLEYYTKGTQPDAFLSLPATWTMDQVKTFQTWLDGLASQRRMLRAIPGDFKYQGTKDPVLKDEYDDYLNRLVCFAFNVTPAALVKMTNRAQSESQHDTALEEGNGPTMKFYEKVWSKIIAKDFDSPDLEMAFVQDTITNPKDKAEIDKIYVSLGVRTIDQIAESLGDDPIGGVASLPMVMTPNGWVPIGANVPVKDGGDLEPAPPPVAGALPGQPGEPVGPNAGLGKPPKAPVEPDKGNQPAKPTKAEKLAKLHVKGYRLHAKATAPRKQIVAAKAAMGDRIAKLLKEVGAHAARQVMSLSKLHKAEDDDDQKSALERAIEIADEVDLGTMTLVALGIEKEATDISKAAGMDALAMFGASKNDDLVNQVSEKSVAYAKDRAAYLVGKRVLDDGTIIDNPDAQYAIDDATRDSLKALITNWLEEGRPMPDLADAIEQDYAFSEKRARMIADTEVANANSAGALTGYRASEAAGNTVLKYWSVNGDQCCDECEANEAVGPIPLEDTFPSGDDAPLAHPNCECVLLSATVNGDDADSGEDDDSAD